MSIANEPAYPMSVPGQFNASGLTKRELFAAMAMQGMYADSNRGGHVSIFAYDAVSAADALIAALEEK